MKEISAIILFVTFCHGFTSAQCSELDEIVANYEEENYESAIEGIATKAALTQLLKRALGKAAGVVTGVFESTTIGTPYDAFVNSLKRMEKLASAEKMDWKSFKKELDQLKSEAQGVRIEEHFGKYEDSKKCYENLDYIVETFERVKDRWKRI